MQLEQETREIGMRKGRPERPGCRHADGIEMDVAELGSQDVTWIRLALYGRVEGSCEHGNEPLGSMKSREYLD